jgi:hypothetical protein
MGGHQKTTRYFEKTKPVKGVAKKAGELPNHYRRIVAGYGGMRRRSTKVSL